MIWDDHERLIDFSLSVADSFLGYDIAPSLKLQVARSHAIAEKVSRIVLFLAFTSINILY